MGTTKSLKPAGGTSLRVTQVDDCGNPLTGGCYAVSECWASVARSAQYSDAQQFAPVNANGQLCFARRNPPGLMWMSYDISLNAVDPVVWQIITGAPLVLDDAVSANTVGFRTRRNQIQTARFALELWMRQEGDCEPDAVPYIYWLSPFVVQGKIADLTIGQDTINFGITEALGIGPSGWGVGPYDIRKDAVTGVPEPLLTAMSAVTGADDLDHFEITTLAPPPPTSGCQPLAPTFTVAPAAGAAPLAVVATLPVGPDALPILPGIIDWGDLSTSVLTASNGPTAPHNYALAGSYTPTYRPSGYSAPVYTGTTVVAA